MFSVLADAQANAVPLVRNTSVKADKDGDVVVDGNSRAGTG